KSYEVLSDFYNQAKSWVAARLADQVPCAWLSDQMEKDCKKLANQAADMGLSAGMAAVGVPPTLPDIQGLEAIGKGKVAEAAADNTCELIKSNGGECTPAMRQALIDSYRKGLDQLETNL